MNPVPGVQQVHSKSLLSDQNFFNIALNYTNVTTNVLHKGLTTNFIPKTKSEQVVAMVTVNMVTAKQVWECQQ